MRRGLLIAVLAGCSRSAPPAHVDAAPADAATVDTVDADIACASSAGESGECIDTSTCASLGDHISEPGHCAGPTSIQCCLKTPDVADNPPVPAGYKLMMQSEVTPEMTTWRSRSCTIRSPIQCSRPPRCSSARCWCSRGWSGTRPTFRTASCIEA